jgi:ABC-2 type transport system permease protein
LALYFLNIRHFTYDIYYIGWVNMVSFLNLSVVGLLFSTFTTRFVFPMISLEGRRFWLLGLLPVRRETILWSKFLFATGGSIIPCTLLVLLSDLMLSVSPLVLVSHQMTCLVLCLGLSGIAVGLGARLPNLREQSPSRIAAGFGGTLNLVISTLYILVVVLLTALPTHFYLAAQYAGMAATGKEQYAMQWWVGLWLVTGVIGSFVLGAIATIVPLRIGFRAFREMEF